MDLWKMSRRTVLSVSVNGTLAHASRPSGTGRQSIQGHTGPPRAPATRAGPPPSGTASLAGTASKERGGLTLDLRDSMVTSTANQDCSSLHSSSRPPTPLVGCRSRNTWTAPKPTSYSAKSTTFAGRAWRPRRSGPEPGGGSPCGWRPSLGKGQGPEEVSSSSRAISWASPDLHGGTSRWCLGAWRRRWWRHLAIGSSSCSPPTSGTARACRPPTGP
jgi:hypothetical protein